MITQQVPSCRRRLRRSALALAVGISSVSMATSPSTSVSASTDDTDTVFISEIHYDNDGTDTGEAIEVFGPAGTELTGWSLVLYNGSNGSVYNTTLLAGSIADEAGGFGTSVVTYPSNGLQNGSPDGIALVAPGDVVQQFISYEGAFTAVGGPASGLTSTDIGVSESGSTTVGDSLQLTGTGSCYGALTWNAPTTSTFGSLGGITPGPCELAPPSLTISEIHYDNDGTDSGEAIELYGTAGTDLTGWSLVLYNGSNGAAYNTIELTDTIADQAGGFGTSVVTLPTNGIQNGSPDGIALVAPGGFVIEFASYEGELVATDGPAAGATSTDIGVSESGSTASNQSLQRSGGNGAWTGPACSSFGEINAVTPDTNCPIAVKIHEVQGPGDESPLVGQRVIIEGVVVGDEEGPAPALRGFFVQEEDADADADPATSEGIFVFNFNDDDVSIGDLVRVEGTVEERFGNTQLSSFVEIEVLGPAIGTPTPATLSFPVTDVDDLEAFEGMAATLPQTLVISEYFNYDRFGDVVVALPAPGEDRPYNPTALFAPDTQEALDRRDLNERSRITIDDGNSSQNPEAPIHPINRELFSADNSFRGGDQVSGLTGPIFYSFGQYRILPYAEGGFTEFVQTEAPATPDEVGGDLTIATLNALNYFLTLDDGVNDVCGAAENLECRGADVAGEFERQRVKLLNTLEGLDADVIGMVEVENRPGVEPLADLASGLNDRFGDGTYDYIDAGVNSVVGTDAIKVGILYRPGSVTPVGVPAVLDTPEFVNPNNLDTPKNRAAVAASFVENASGEVFSVTVNHFKSKGSSCGAGDDDPLAGSCNDTRTKAAQALDDWLQTDPTGIADDDWLILGDLNAYDKETPIATLQAAGYTDLIAEFVGEFAYSFVFSGEFGYLDYIMSSDSMTPQVTGATEWHINADEPDIFDYDTSFKSDYQDSLFDPTTPFRSSDHDAALIGLDLDGSDAEAAAWPGNLWPANGKLRDVFIIATGPGSSIDVRVLDVVSSEADSGLARRDRPDDIVMVSDTRVSLRAERFSDDGRTYTISVEILSDGQVRYDTIEVFVPRRGPQPFQQ